MADALHQREGRDLLKDVKFVKFRIPYRMSGTSPSSQEIIYNILVVLACGMTIIDLYYSYQCLTTTFGTCTLESGSYVFPAIFLVTALFSGYRLLSLRRMRLNVP